MSSGDQRTPLGQTDPPTVEAFWGRFLDATGHPRDSAQPEAWAFGDSVELADELIALVVHGPKRATAGLLADYEAVDEPVTSVGQLEIVTDGAMRPRAVLEITDVRVGPLSSVDDKFAFDEGEGDRSRSYWLDAHTRAFQRSSARLDIDFDADMLTVFERFEVLYVED